MNTSRAYILGVTGGLASGKSTVMATLRRCGAAVIDADRIARDVLRPGTRQHAAVVRAFGSSVIRRDGSLNRPALARAVFSDPRRRRTLEHITHPAIIARLRADVKKYARDGRSRLIAAEVPLLYEAGLESLFDAVLVVWVPRAVQLRRLMARAGMTGAEALRRINAQLPLSTKRTRADFVIRNTGTRADASREVRKLYERLTKSMK